jgi:GDP-mannose 6-dehydrogenase
MGYVGCVTAACLAKAGHSVTGVDINLLKVEMINAGKSPIIEKGLDDMISESVRHGALKATTNYVTAVLESEISLVCVGTPSNGNGSPDLNGMKAVAEQIGRAMDSKSSYHCVVFRSTVLPGTVRKQLIPILTRHSNGVVHRDFDVCFNPEFLREGTAVADFYDPPLTVIGHETCRGAEVVAALYDKVDGPVERTTYEIAEMVKYAANSFHALKVTFANEIGVICKSIGIDSHRVMDLFIQDRTLNISSAYLKPGFAFGGSCLPKDVRAILHKAKEMDLALPVMSSVLESNRLHIQRAIDRILSTKRKRVGVLGLGFKPGTDDMRESPVVTLVEALVGKGCHVTIYDPDVFLGRVFGTNKEFIEQEIPHISSLMCSSIDAVISQSDLIVICQIREEFRNAIAYSSGDKIILDLVRIGRDISVMPESYEGLCW